MKPVKPKYSLGFFLPHALRWLVTGSLLVVLGIAAYIGVRFYHIDTRLYLWWSATAPEAMRPKTGSLPLQDYRLDIDGRAVDGIDRNLSGLAFNADTKTLIAVVNRPATLLVLDLDGKVLRRHRLRNTSDVEGVAYLGDNRVALTEEGRGRVVIAQLPANAKDDLDLRNANSIALDMGTPEEMERHNAGFEGLGYDRKNDQLYVAKEHSPRALYRISGLGQHIKTGRIAMRVENLDRWLDHNGIGTDLSSVDINNANGHVLLLSDESQSIVELNPSGKAINRMELRALSSQAGIPQPEGLALGEQGTLYMVSEPNLFYRLVPKNGAISP